MPAEPETISAYVANLADIGRSLSTIQNIVAAVGFMHGKVDTPNPVKHQHVRMTLARITRGLGIAPKYAKAPATVQVVSAMVANCDLGTLKGVWDRALLLTGFATAMRRSELAAHDVTDLQHSQGDGFRITIRRSKGDQDGNGQTVGLIEGQALKPAGALRAWLDASQITSGRVFRSVAKGGKITDYVARNGDMLSGQAIADVVKHYAAAAGFDCSGEGCPASYTLTNTGENEVLWQVHVVHLHCADPACQTEFVVYQSKAKLGATWKCKECQKINQIVHGARILDD